MKKSDKKTPDVDKCEPKMDKHGHLESKKLTVTREWVKEVAFLLKHLPEWEGEDTLINALKFIGAEVSDE